MFGIIPFFSMNKLSVDPDAQAFIDAAGITDETQQSAIDTLVVGLKADSLWTKMTALYPIVGGTADTHKYNLKDPQDTDGAYRITWSGGITHTSTGADPNGTTGEGDTHLDPSSTTDGHLSFYSRDNTWQSGSVGTDNIDMGGASSPATRYLLSAGLSDTNSPVVGFGDPINTQTGAADGYFLGVLDGTDSVLYKNGSVLGTASISSISDGTFNIGLFHAEGVGGRHTNRECAFASIGSKLTSTEAANLNTLVQAFNTTLSRNIWEDADTQAFIDATGITDYTEQSAINDLVVGLKADSLWTKMIAIYPFVGGTSTTNKYNLKDPQDTDAAFRLTFAGGITHTDGMLPNGTTGYAETHIVPFTDLTLTDVSMTTYINTNNVPLSSDTYEMGLYESATKAILLSVKNPSPDYEYSFRYNGAIGTASSTTAAAMHTITRTSTSGYIYKDGVEEHTFTADGTALPTNNLKTLLLCNIGVNSGGSPAGVYSNGWSNQRQVFTSIGDGLDATQAANLNTIVEAYQVALGRNN